MKGTDPSCPGCCVVRWIARERPHQLAAGVKEDRYAALAGQAWLVSRTRRGAGGRLGERAGSAWCSTNHRGKSRGTSRASGDYLEGGEKAVNHEGRRGAGGLSNLTLILRCIHHAHLKERADRGGTRVRVVVLSGFGASRARGSVAGWLSPQLAQ